MLFVGGLQSVIVQLLPMPFTYGESVIAWSQRRLGLRCSSAGLALYMQFVVRPNPDNVTWSNLWFVGAFLVRRPRVLGLLRLPALVRLPEGRRPRRAPTTR